MCDRVNRALYSQLEGGSRGRCRTAPPLREFPGAASRGASNYVIDYTGPYLNEVMARNRTAVTNGAGQVADWVELFNPNPTNVNLGGMSLSVDELEPGQWIFPPNTTISANGYLVLWCDGSRNATGSR